MVASAFDHTVTDFQMPHAYWLARSAKLAYADEAAIRTTAAEWGFDRVQHLRAELDPSFPIEDVQAFAAGSDRMVVVAFRGTEPAKIQDWLSDAATLVAPGPAGKGLVHQGFSQALDAVYPQVLKAVERLRDGQQSLWFTGHGLGGALAVLASARLYFEDPELLANGVCTFGQPRTCDRFLAESYDEAFAARTFRFVNNNDVVAQLPPEPFHHVRDLRYFGADGELRAKMTVLGGAADPLPGFTGDPFAPAADGVRDHVLDRYVELVENSIS
ncbi:lipase family protein [Saccharopolyspora sp. NPDC000359]|uniref:lipase family protein n=1 Tax=Saccharopolyspora sp. NPDC000359 TaxID=3154251 RepID=UPI00331CAAF7